MNETLLKKLCETPGISSREERVRELVISELKGLTDRIRVDAMGNVIATCDGKRPRVMLAAHMDEIGFMVKFIDDKGFLRLQPVGGWDPRNMVAQRVWVHGYAGKSLRGALQPSSKPIHMLTSEEMNKPPKIEEFYVDLGLPVDEVRKRVEVGDMVTMDRTMERIGDCVLSKSLDNRISVFVMIEALRAMKSHEVEIVAVATSQEEVGLRGATTAAFGVEPDIGVALDVTLANDFPGPADHEQVTRLGQGAAVKIMDASVISHPKLVHNLREVASREGIATQLEIMPRGGTDAGALQRSRVGVPSITISVPTRYVHSVNEMAHVGDIEAAISLLARFLEEAHQISFDKI